MSPRLRTVSLAFLAASAFVLSGALPGPFGTIAGGPAFAQGNGGSHGGGGGGNSSSSSSSHGGGGSSASSSSASSGSNGKSSTAPGRTKTSSQFASASSHSSSGTPKALIRQYVLATGLKQGDVARVLKSWNSLNRNLRAFAATAGKTKSLPALQVAYIRDNALAEDQLAAFTALGGDPNNPPSQDQFDAASSYLAAQQLLAEADGGTGVDAATVLADPNSFDPALVDAANTVNDYGGPDAQTVVDQFNAWSDYQTAEAAAADAFKAASVSYRNADQATLDSLRNLVDDIVATQGLDTLASNP